MGRFDGPAPLLAVPSAPVPPGAEAVWVQGAGGVRLRAALFQPTATLRGSVVVSPGRTEFIEKYFEIVRELTGRGFVVLVHDWRGQGLSDRLHRDNLRGHARGGLSPFLADLTAVLDAFQGRLPRPWLTLAHSMGAGLTTVALARGQKRFVGAVLSAPMFGVHGGRPRALAAVTRLSLLTMGSGRIAYRMEPGGGPGARLSHDAWRMERWREQMRAHPQLALGGLTWGWLNMALAVGRALTPRALASIDLPVAMLLAGQDAAIDNAAIKRAAERIPDARLIEFPDSWHEILMETDDVRAGAWAAFDALAERVAPSAPTA